MRVEVLSDAEEALKVLRELSRENRASFYQTEKFLLAWLSKFAAREKAQPFFIVAHDGAGAPLALVPLGLYRFGPLRVAKFLGGKHSNYNLGLFREGRGFGAGEARALLDAAARATPRGPHLYCLGNMPLFWRGAANPLAALPHRPAAADAYATGLRKDGAAFLAERLSPDTRKKLRKKEQRLAAMGTLRAFRAGSAEEAREILDAFFAHKCGRSEFHLPQEELAARRRFYDALTAFEADGPAAAELHALALDGKIIATLAAGCTGDRMQGMFISYDSSPEIAKFSPGKILLSRVLRDACGRNFSTFDLGVGDMPYKTTFCNEVEPLVEVYYAPSWPGRLARPLFVAASAFKAQVKRRPHLFAVATKLRGALSRWRR